MCHDILHTSSPKHTSLRINKRLITVYRKRIQHLSDVGQTNMAHCCGHVSKNAAIAIYCFPTTPSCKTFAGWSPHNNARRSCSGSIRKSESVSKAASHSTVKHRENANPSPSLVMRLWIYLLLSTSLQALGLGSFLGCCLVPWQRKHKLRKLRLIL